MGTAPHAASGTDDDAIWLERARAGDTEAFRRLVLKHQGRAFAIALRIVGSAAEAEEAAQDAFVRAWLALPRFRGEASFRTWLYRIVTNRALDRATRLRRRAAVEVDPAGLGEEGRADAADAGDMSDDARARELERMIGRLPPSQRAAITLYYYEDRSVEEVAATLGMPAGTVKTHLRRARGALRKAWIRRTGRSGS